MAQHQRQIAGDRESQELEAVMRLQFEERLTGLHSLNRTTTQAARRNAGLVQERQAVIVALEGEREAILKKLDKERAAHEDLKVRCKRSQDTVELKKAEVSKKDDMIARLRLNHEKSEADCRSLKKQLHAYEKSVALDQRKISDMLSTREASAESQERLALLNA